MYKSFDSNTIFFSDLSTMGDKSRKNSSTQDVEANVTSEQQQVEAVTKAVHGHPVSEHPTTLVTTI